MTYGAIALLNSLGLAIAAVLSSGFLPGPRLDPDMELQSEALTPEIVLDEIRVPIHRVRILADIDGRGPGRGMLVLDPNAATFDEFGELSGGVLTPQARGKAGPFKATELECFIEFVKEGKDAWLLLRLSGPKVASSIVGSTRGPILEGGPARFLVLGSDKKVKSVVDLTRYGLVVP